MAVAYLRFYAELNDLIPADKRQRSFAHSFVGHPSVKDAIEAHGVPHTEVDLVVVNGTSVGLDYGLQEGDRVSVYPVFESLDISSEVRLRAKPLRHTAFILDVHLGKLARLLRMLGFDALYRRDYVDAEIVRLARAEQRIILTRDLGILKQKAVTHGYYVRSTQPIHQASEVVRRFDLRAQVKPLTRCLRCNGTLDRVAKSAVLSQLPAKTALYYDQFYRCETCEQIYWPGSHHDSMLATIHQILEGPPRKATHNGRPPA